MRLDARVFFGDDPNIANMVSWIDAGNVYSKVAFGAAQFKVYAPMCLLDNIDIAQHLEVAVALISQEILASGKIIRHVPDGGNGGKNRRFIASGQARRPAITVYANLVGFLGVK